MSTTSHPDPVALREMPLAELLVLANAVRKEYVGDDLEVCSIINAKSGACSQDCKFCAQSARHTASVDTYPLKTKSEIVAAATEAKRIGARKFGIVTSGNRLNQKELAVIVAAVSEIQETLGLDVCGSLGALPKADLQQLHQAGMSRYHHNIETSERFYPHIVSTHTFQERVDTIRAAQETGFEVCSGGIIGMGETWQDRIDMALMLKNLKVDSVPINFLIPMKGTPFESLQPISCTDAVRTLCIFRIVLRDSIVKIAAGRETVLKDFQGLGFMAGANGMLIGGYLTVKGRAVEQDQALIEEIKRLWMQ